MKPGKAYGLFKCRASKEEIEELLNTTIRPAAQTPNELELSLFKGLDRLRLIEGLGAIVKEAEEAGIQYTMEATYPGAGNRTTADELGHILNQTYNSPLYTKEEDERRKGAVVYKRGSRYVFKRK